MAIMINTIKNEAELMTDTVHTCLLKATFILLNMASLATSMQMMLKSACPFKEMIDS